MRGAQCAVFARGSEAVAGALPTEGISAEFASRSTIWVSMQGGQPMRKAFCFGSFLLK
jgi:hypothetical protein